MCTNGVLFIQRVNKIKTQVHKRYCTAVWFYNGYRKKKDSKNVSCINPITN